MTLEQRALAARKLIRLGLLEPLVALSYVVWPDVEQDDPDAGTFAVDRRREMAA